MATGAGLSWKVRWLVLAGLTHKSRPLAAGQQGSSTTGGWLAVGWGDGAMGLSCSSRVAWACTLGGGGGVPSPAREG